MTPAKSNLVIAPIVPFDVAPADKPVARGLDTLLVVGLCTVLAFAVMAFGAAEYWAMCTLQVSSAALLVVWALRELANGKISIVGTPLFVPLLLLAGLVAIQLLWPRTEYWYATWVRTIQWVCYAILFFVATQSLRGERRLKAFGLFLACFGSLVAVIAIAQGGTASDKVFWLFPTDPGSVLYGPYPNHAHYAGLMEMLFPIPLVLGLGSLYRSHAKVLLLFAALLMASSIFLAASFGGILSFGGELIVLAILLLRQRRKSRVLISVLVLLLLLALLVVMLQPVMLQDRLEHVSNKADAVDVDVRLSIVRDSIPMVLKRPLLGYGLGTFVEVFPSFRTFYSNNTINAAHNDYVQAVVELGLIGFALILSLIYLLYREGLRKSKHWEHDFEASLSMAALVGCSGILIHSLCDFNLQIPANAAVFAVLAGIAVTKALGVNREDLFVRRERRNAARPSSTYSVES